MHKGKSVLSTVEHTLLINHSVQLMGYSETVVSHQRPFICHHKVSRYNNLLVLMISDRTVGEMTTDSPGVW